MNEIRIPWYHKRVKRVNPLTFDPFSGFDFPDRDKTPNRRPQPDPKPSPQPQPEPIRIREDIYNPDGTTETIFRELETPIPVIIPSRLPNNGEKPLPTFDGKDKNNPTIPATNWRDRIPTRSPSPQPGMATPIKMPGGEILFKLMEAQPDGKYNDFLEDYNDLTLKLTWNIANPFIVYSQPSYEQVKEFLNTHDYETITKNDVLEYFKELGVKGKDLSSLPARLYFFKTTVDTLTIIEDIVVPPIQPGNGWEQS